MSTDAQAKPGCVTLLLFGLIELAAAVAFGYFVYLVALPMLGDRNAVPTALLLSPIGAYIADRFVKRALGWSLLRAIIEPFAGW